MSFRLCYILKLHSSLLLVKGSLPSPGSVLQQHCNHSNRWSYHFFNIYKYKKSHYNYLTNNLVTQTLSKQKAKDLNYLFFSNSMSYCNRGALLNFRINKLVNSEALTFWKCCKTANGSFRKWGFH